MKNDELVQHLDVAHAGRDDDLRRRLQEDSHQFEVRKLLVFGQNLHF